jgi:parvulin-like peptidyl-prolyl isomerase
LGNKKIFTHNPQDNNLKRYISHYNVYENDPERMGKYGVFNTTSQFHVDYLKKLLNEKNISYTKNNPSDTAEGYYLEQLIKRIKETDDLKSFRSFIETIERFR